MNTIDNCSVSGQIKTRFLAGGCSMYALQLPINGGDKTHAHNQRQRH